MKEFLAWARLTNTTKVFPAFPDRAQAERVAIFPSGMDAFYQATQANILERARYYVEKISVTYGAQTQVPAADAQARYQALEAALTGRRTDATAHKEGSAAVDAEELEVCAGLYFVYGGLVRQHHRTPALAYAYFPFPQATGTPADDNLPDLPPAPSPSPAG